MNVSDERMARALVRANRRQSRTLAFLWEWCRSVAIALAVFFLVRSFLIEAFKIPTGSMEGTLLVGDFLLVNKLVYGAELPFTGVKLPAIRKPQRGDVIVFQWPVDRTKNFVKRVVGLPDDTLEMRHGNLMRNGVLQREPYVSHTSPGMDVSDEEFDWQLAYLLGGNHPVKSPPRSPLSVGTLEARPGYHPTRNNWGPLVVPEGNYFVLGDNRDNSLDSRYWGWVADSLVRGQPLVVYYSYNPDGAVKLDWLTRVRWKRFGEMVQ